jgi:glycogen debranching enzyme
MDGQIGALRGAARRVLDRNWVGASTVPSPDLYPHQWSWDSAFIAIGRSWDEQERAQQELRSLFEAQWSNGMVPHIVFNPDVPAHAYFPGPDFWQSSTLCQVSPRHVETSGITQPPIHARAAWEIYRHAKDRASARAFLEELRPRLAAQHEYLLTARDPLGRGLATLVHPWESGLDNSPVWEDLLEMLEIPKGAIPPYHRRDLVNANPADRPTNRAYDRFVYLAATYRQLGYDDTHIAQVSPFLTIGPLFNAIFLWSCLALAEIAEELGGDGGPHRAMADGLRSAIQRELWDADRERFYSRDLRTDRLIEESTVISFMPLLDPELPPAQVQAIVGDLDSPSFHPMEGDEHFLVPSSDLRGRLFDPRRYWRGPVWMNTDWLLCCGLRQHGRDDLAREIEDDMLELVTRSGFHEYFDPFGGTGYGSDQFSWTAALVLDLLERRAP